MLRGAREVRKNIFAENTDEQLVMIHQQNIEILTIRYPEMFCSSPIEMNDTDSEDEHIIDLF